MQGAENLHFLIQSQMLLASERQRHSPIIGHVQVLLETALLTELSKTSPLDLACTELQ